MKKILTFIMALGLTCSLFAAVPKSPLVSAQTQPENSRVNINRADLKELQTVHGIGVSKAKAIIAYRSEHGKFKTLSELKKIQGIGDKKLTAIEKDITL